LHRLLALGAVLRPLQVRQPREQLVDRSFPWVYVPHRSLNVIVSGNVLQCKGISVLSGLGQKRVTKSVQASVGMGGDLLPYLAYLFFEHSRPERLYRILRARENIVALGVLQKPFEYFLHFVINHQLALSRSPFQTALDCELSADFPIRTLLRVEANAIFHQL
jgi:hypothetical protein